MRGIGGGRAPRFRLVRLLEGNVDDVVLVLAEGVDVDIADQRDIDCRGISVDPLVDRCHIRRRRHLGVGQIEIEHGAECQCQLLVVQHRGDADAIRHLEHEPHEGRLHQRAHANQRTLLGLGGGALQAQCALGGARPLGQLAHDFHGQAGRRPAPAVGQKIDEDPLAGGHGVDGRPARQRQPDRRAVRVAPCGRDVVRHRVRQFVDGDVDRAGEPDHDDGTCGGHLRIDILGELEDQPRVAA